MQPYRITTRTVPRVCRRAAACPSPVTSRNMFATPFFHPAVTSDFGPLFRLLDSAAAELVPSSANTRDNALRRHQASLAPFTPRFDVRELDNNYELQGEVPGIQQQDLQIEFVDERTLVIRGRTQRERNEANVDNTAASTEKTVDQAQQSADKVTAAPATDDAASEKSSNYHKASVEDEYVDAGAEADTAATEQQQSEKPTSDKVAESSTAAAAAPSNNQAADPAFKYWVSERSVGEFERRFAFPGRVDQDAVTASLKNGILSVVVPKIVEKQARKIEIQ